jgi:hypothetical protein
MLVMQLKLMRSFSDKMEATKSTSSSLPILVPFPKYRENFTKTHKNHPTIDTPNLHFLVG